MGEEERKVSDLQCEYLQAITDGWEQQDATWTKSRLIVTTQKLVLVSIEGTRFNISYDDIDKFEDRVDVNKAARAQSKYIGIRVGDDVLLIKTAGDLNYDKLETDIYRGVLNRTYLKVRHPVKSGGFIKNPDWKQARLKISDDGIVFTVADGRRFMVPRHTLIDAHFKEKVVDGTKYEIINMEYVADGRTVESEVAVKGSNITFLHRLAENDKDRHRISVDLGEGERRVLIALYSGIPIDSMAEVCSVREKFVDRTVSRMDELEVINRDDNGTYEVTPRGQKLANQVEVN